jgi:hypothetical protein
MLGRSNSKAAATLSLEGSSWSQKIDISRLEAGTSVSVQYPSNIDGNESDSKSQSHKLIV